MVACFEWATQLIWCFAFGLGVTFGDCCDALDLLLLLFVLLTVGLAYLIVLVSNFKGGGFMYFVLSGFV